MDVSIIIPTYNRRSLISEAINSCLQENRLDLRLQIIVVDDCSTDGSREVLAEYGSLIERVFLEKNAGQCHARNAGLKQVVGRYVKFLDSDDVLEKGTLIEEVRLADQESADIVVSDWGNIKLNNQGKSIDGSEVKWAAPDMHPLPDSILYGKAVPTSAALYRATYIKGLEWDPIVQKLDDWDWFCQAAMLGGKIVSLNKVSYWMRDHMNTRVTTSATMLLNARDHHRILLKLERELREHGQLTAPRAKRLAQYYYKELRVLSLYDRAAFEFATSHILSLDPKFRPIDEEPVGYMRVLAGFIGFQKATLLHTYIKRLIKRIS